VHLHAHLISLLGLLERLLNACLPLCLMKRRLMAWINVWTYFVCMITPVTNTSTRFTKEITLDQAAYRQQASASLSPD
jgi:hypothetical protein